MSIPGFYSRSGFSYINDSTLYISYIRTYYIQYVHVHIEMPNPGLASNIKAIIQNEPEAGLSPATSCRAQCIRENFSRRRRVYPTKERSESKVGGEANFFFFLAPEASRSIPNSSF